MAPQKVDYYLQKKLNGGLLGKLGNSLFLHAEKVRAGLVFMRALYRSMVRVKRPNCISVAQLAALVLGWRPIQVELNLSNSRNLLGPAPYSYYRGHIMLLYSLVAYYQGHRTHLARPQPREPLERPCSIIKNLDDVTRYS